MAEKEYIERSEALDAIRHSDSLYSAYVALAKLRYADVREVVLCRDCKNSEPWYADKSRCFLWHESGIDVFNDGFCNYGVKREER